jgi:putative DNA primase/helicase
MYYNYLKEATVLIGSSNNTSKTIADFENLPWISKNVEDQAGNSTDWKEPMPLIAKSASERYPVEALPKVMRAAVEEVVGFVKAPLPLVTLSALGALSVSIQAYYNVKRSENLIGPISLFLLAVADSGERKSTCDRIFMDAIRQYEAVQAMAAKPVLNDYTAQMEAWEAKRAGIKDSMRKCARSNKSTSDLESRLRELEHEKPERPRVPRFLYADFTPEALAYGLAKSWPSGGVVSAEAGTVFGSHGMNKDSIMRNLSLLNQLWDGTPIYIDRRSNDSFMLSGVRLTVALQVQEPTLKEFFKGSGTLARGTGFLSRFLLACPESTQGQRRFTEPPEHWPSIEQFNRRLLEILNQSAPIDCDGKLTPRDLSLSVAAKAKWVEFYNSVEAELYVAGELYDVRDVASKSADNVARLAALLHVFENGAGEEITVEAVESASKIVRWHLYEAKRFFGEITLPVEFADAVRLDEWLISYCRRERVGFVKKNAVLQFGPLRKSRTLDAAIRELFELSRVRCTQDGQASIITVNPALLAITN